MPTYFSRVPASFRPVIEAARDLLPPAALRIEPRFLCGVDPRFVGLHSASLSDYADYKDVVGALDYDSLAHACFTGSAADERQTIVFPKLDGVYDDPVATVLHEWGHLLDEYTGFAFAAPTTTPYSKVNRLEAFAEAFEVICRPPNSAWREWAESAATLRPMRDLLEIA